MKLLFKILWPYLLMFALALTAAWYIWSPKPAPPEIYTPEVKQSDGSVILEKKPDAKVKPTFKVPKGSTVERVVKITVKPKDAPPIVSKQDTVIGAETTTQNTAKEAAITCPPTNIEIALVRHKDESRSVIVKSDNGEIVGAVDIPVEAAKPVFKPKLWAIGAVVNPVKETFGGFIDRDIGWVRVGAQINQIEQGSAYNQYWLKAGIRF